MSASAVNLKVQNSVLVTLALVSIAVTPWISLDPINLPKYFCLAVGSLFSFGLIFSNLYNNWKNIRVLVITSIAFLICMLLTLFFSGAAIIEQFIGANGRNTGILTYMFLVLIMISSSFLVNLRFIDRLLMLLLATGTFNCLYGYLQLLNLDPISWRNPYNPIVGTLGNPNFASTFLGISGSVAFALLLKRDQSGIFKGFLVSFYFASLFLIFKSDSIQGLVLVFVSTILLTYMKFGFFRNSKLKALITLSSFPALGLFVFAGFFNVGPLSSLLFQQTGIYRVDYWKAALRMTFEHPFFGVGLDGYGDWYRESRDLTATLRRGPEMISNSAHNIFLDLSSGGGLPLITAYLALVTITLRAAWKVINSLSSYDCKFFAVFIAYLCYLLQSLISINQIGIAIWGWVFSGVIIGYKEFAYNENFPSKVNRVRQRVEKLPAGTLLRGIIGLCLGLMLAIPPIKKDNELRRALESSDGIKIGDLAYSFPRTSQYMNYAMIIFSENELENQAYKIAKDTVRIFPRNFKGWEFIYRTELSSALEKSEAMVRLQSLDPHNELFKK